MRIAIAFRLFFKALFNGEFAGKAAKLLTAAAESTPAHAVSAPQKFGSSRSDALTLISVLQREARLVDFLKENITSFNDAQVGAAVRDVHRDAAAALDRIFSFKAVVSQVEGATVDVPANSDAGRIRLTGNVGGKPPYSGTLRHGGWEAARVQLPEWNGTSASAQVIAPAEVELR